MTDKIIKINTHPNINLTVSVTEQMVKDYRQCAEDVNSPNFDGRDCEQCSWWHMDIFHTGICECDEIKVLLE